MAVPAKGLVDLGVGGPAVLESHQDLFRGVLLHVVKPHVLKVLGAQPQEDSSGGGMRQHMKRNNKRGMHIPIPYSSS